MSVLRLICVQCDNDLDVLVGTCNGATVAKVFPCQVCAKPDVKQLSEENAALKEENQRLLEIAMILRREVPAGFLLCDKCARTAFCSPCTARNGWAGFRKKGQ